MTTGPRLVPLGRYLVPGFLAAALFGVIALVVVNTGFGETMTGFPDDVSITAELGYAMFDLTALQSAEGGMGATEQFLISFLLVAVVLDAALDASLVLAKREEEGQPVTALLSTGASQARGEGVGAGPGTAADGGSATADDDQTGGDASTDGGERA